MDGKRYKALLMIRVEATEPLSEDDAWKRFEWMVRRAANAVKAEPQMMMAFEEGDAGFEPIGAKSIE